jgi:hypothetical protein
MDEIDSFSIKKRSRLNKKGKGVHMDEIDSFSIKKVITIEEKTEGSTHGRN